MLASVQLGRNAGSLTRCTDLSGLAKQGTKWTLRGSCYRAVHVEGAGPSRSRVAYGA